MSFFDPPTVTDVGCAERGDVGRDDHPHGQAIEMAPILRGQSGDKRRPPARDETVGRIERAQAREAGVDDPQFVAGKRELVDANVAGDVRRARNETGIVLADRLDLGGDVGCVAKLPNLVAAAERQRSPLIAKPIGRSKVRTSVDNPAPATRATSNLFA